MKWKPGTGLSAQYFITSDCGAYRICKGGHPPVYTLSRIGGGAPELVLCGSLEACKRRAADDCDPH